MTHRSKNYESNKSLVDDHQNNMTAFYRTVGWSFDLWPVQSRGKLRIWNVIDIILILICRWPEWPQLTSETVRRGHKVNVRQITGKNLRWFWAIRSEIKQTFEFLSPENRPISSIIIVHAKVHSKLQAFSTRDFLTRTQTLSLGSVPLSLKKKKRNVRIGQAKRTTSNLILSWIWVLCQVWKIRAKPLPVVKSAKLSVKLRLFSFFFIPTNFANF